MVAVMEVEPQEELLLVDQEDQAGVVRLHLLLDQRAGQHQSVKVAMVDQEQLHLYMEEVVAVAQGLRVFGEQALKAGMAVLDHLVLWQLVLLLIFVVAVAQVYLLEAQQQGLELLVLVVMGLLVLLMLPLDKQTEAVEAVELEQVHLAQVKVDRVW
jgi:hypothetical protein